MGLSGDLFAPCERYEIDPDLAPMRESMPASCVDCIHQYEPGQVCPAFQSRLLTAAGLERGKREALETTLRQMD